MKTATVTEFRTRAKELLQEVEDDQDILILSRPKSQEGFVVLTMRHFESLEETAHLLSTPANAARLMEGIAEAKAGVVAHSFTLDNLMKLAPAAKVTENPAAPARIVVAGRRGGITKQSKHGKRRR